ncbi:MAG: hypothetical protein K8R36_19335 [Planctomycetales bacterium]|nr:hypothetical protein [Planctomycetales bacterium]
MTMENPYLQLVRAAQGMVGADNLSGYEPIESGAEALLTRNAVPLAAVRALDWTACSIPLRYDQDFFNEHCPTYEPCRNVARLLVLEFRLSQARLQLCRAVRVALELHELGNIFYRGGLIVDWTLGSNWTGISVDLLRRIRRELSEEDRQLIIVELARLTRTRDPFSEIAARDHTWGAGIAGRDEKIDPTQLPLPLDPEQYGIPEEVQREILRAIVELANRPEEARHKDAENMDLQNIAMLHMLRIDLALRSYQATCGRYPDRLIDLVPDYLPALPSDPFTQKAFLYRMTGGKAGDPFILYSTGSERIDRGGTFGSWLATLAGHCDLCLDSRDYEDSDPATDDPGKLIDWLA